MPKYTVKYFRTSDNCHMVIDEKGETRLVDLMVCGNFPPDTDPESLVGKTFEAEYDYPYISIAMHVNPLPL